MPTYAVFCKDVLVSCISNMIHNKVLLLLIAFMLMYFFYFHIRAQFRKFRHCRKTENMKGDQSEAFSQVQSRLRALLLVNIPGLGLYDDA